VNCYLEKARAQKIVSSSLGASVSIRTSSPIYERLKERESFLPTCFIVSQVDLILEASPELDEKIRVVVSPARGTKCERCWLYAEEVGQNTEHPTLCGRCVGVVGGLIHPQLQA
jgi:isoleucyl-tRNA synthetase